MEYLTLPFEWIGGLLCRLSLSGDVGNMVAVICYALIGALPLFVIFYLGIKEKQGMEDALLLVLSGLLYVLLWFFVNPHCIGVYFRPTGGNRSVLTVFAVSICGTFLAWALLHFLHVGREMEQKGQLHFLRHFLMFCVAFLTAVTLGQGVTEFLTELHTKLEASIIIQDMRLDYIVWMIQIVTDKLPKLLILCLVLLIVFYLSDCEDEQCGEDKLIWIEYLKMYSRKFVVVALSLYVGVNVGQIWMAKYMLYSSFTLKFPLWESVFMIAVSLLSQFYLDSRRLKVTCDKFI